MCLKKIGIEEHSLKTPFATAYIRDRDYIKNFFEESFREVCSHVCKSMDYHSSIKIKMIEEPPIPQNTK